ncbi:MAG: 4-hydroxy-tetrahydrodipicolinate synthase [Candidatus Hydrogenedentales bacterium]
MFRGSIVALVTPFKENLSIDFDAYGRLIEFQIENGTHGIVPCGCTGEAATLSHDEQEQIIRYAVERVAGRVPVIAGTGSNNTREATRLTKFAQEVGADGALLITPYYNKPTPAGLIAHYRAIADAASLPIMLYNVPSRTGTKIEPETVAELHKIPGVVSIKEACGSVDQVSQILALCDINVVSGDDSLTLPMMAVGARGVVSVAANVVPDRIAALCDAFDGGNLAEAQAIHRELTPLFKGLFVETNPMPVKFAVAELGLFKNVLRLPLTPLLEKHHATVRNLLKHSAVASN